MSSLLYPPTPLTDEVVLITGATAGIGEACAWRFAEGGARLILLGRRIERLEALAAALLEKYGTLSHTLQFDVQNIEAIAALPDQLPPSHREVSILVNNAGLALGTAGADANDMADVMTMINTNVTAVMGFARAFLPGFRARGKGHLINVGSIAGHEAYGGGSAYCATKHAVDAFTTAARHDLVGTPVRVTAISPGATTAGRPHALLGPSCDYLRPSCGYLRPSCDYLRPSCDCLRPSCDYLSPSHGGRKAGRPLGKGTGPVHTGHAIPEGGRKAWRGCFGSRAGVQRPFGARVCLPPQAWSTPSSRRYASAPRTRRTRCMRMCAPPTNAGVPHRGWGPLPERAAAE